MPSPRPRPDVGAATVQVPRDRLGRWVDNFALHHGEPETALSGDEVTLCSPDGAVAVIRTPYGPIAAGRTVGDPVVAMLEHMAVDRLVGVLLARRGGHAAGIFHGNRLVRSKVGSSYVQGRTKAGGWSQQRYARRRANQADKAGDRAADDAVKVLVDGLDEVLAGFASEAAEAGRGVAPSRTEMVALRCGGDREMCEKILADPRLTSIAALWQPPIIHQVGEPRLRTLQDFVDQVHAVRIALNDQARLR